MESFVCDVCEFEYIPEVGSPKQGIAPGTSFIDLPADWKCPICGAGKDHFH